MGGCGGEKKIMGTAGKHMGVVVKKGGRRGGVHTLNTSQACGAPKR